MKIRVSYNYNIQMFNCFYALYINIEVQFVRIISPIKQFKSIFAETKHHTTPTHVDKEKHSTSLHGTGTAEMFTSTSTFNVNENAQQDEYGLKLIVGSVIGIAMAFVLFIIFVRTFWCPPPPPFHKGIFSTCF